MKPSLNRRQFLSSAAGLTAATILPNSLFASHRMRSPVEGVNLGVITYSFRSMPGSADDLLDYLIELGLGTVEMMGTPIEAFAGAPEAPPKKKGKSEDKEVYREELRKWRTGASMERFKLLKRKYDREDIKIEIVKFPLDRMSKEEIDYCFKVAETLGAKGITLERSDEAVDMLSPYADQHERLIGYHNHAKVDFNSWDTAMERSVYNAINLDVGHYVAGTNKSPIPLIKKYHDRILNLHLKDRKKKKGANMPWGEGDTPLVDILRLMRDKKSPFMATIELEYPIPEDSDAVQEVQKCIEFCQNALG